jgi:formylglycine-generating enzyme required for sulfatase activity
MAGNVWEWTRTLWGKGWFEPDFKYPYNARDGRENPGAGNEALRVLRGDGMLQVIGHLCHPPPALVISVYHA